MIRRFITKVGGPNDTIICFGDASAAFLARLRGHAPSVKGIGVRRLFQLHHFRVYLIDEYRTSNR
jgi:hypothetical protein